MEAFNVKRSTVFLWKKQFNEGNYCIEALNNKTTKPIQYRVSNVDERITGFIKDQRYQHKRMGKDKLKPLLDEYCISLNINPVSSSTIGRIINKLKKNKELLGERKVKVTLMGKTGKLIIKEPKKKKTKLRVKDYKPTFAGDLVQIDTIVKYINNIKRYVITAIDIKSRVVFAYSYTNSSSKTATDFLDKLIQAFPFDIRRIQTDNGHELLKYFEQAVKTKGIIHYFNYPRCPKMNAFVERFNRTLQDEYLNDNIYLLADDVVACNTKLMEYLYWYNTTRPHFSLRQIPPLKYLINTEYHVQSKMLWTHTLGCFFLFKMLFYLNILIY